MYATTSSCTSEFIMTNMVNAFESGFRKLIPAVLIYARQGDCILGDRILMVYRNGKEGDYHQGKWNGLGGKLEAGESMIEAASRELAEEAGLNIEPARFEVLGTLQFPLFKPHRQEDWLVFVLSVDLEVHEKPWSRGPEGDLHFVEAGELTELNVWEGDRLFLPLVRERKRFVGCIWYEQGMVARSWIQEF